jgi:hypothetical protein
MDAQIHEGVPFEGTLSTEKLFERGLAFAAGRSGPVDLIAAHQCFNLAAFAGDMAAARRREELAAEMSRAQIAEALRAAREWLSRH